MRADFQSVILWRRSDIDHVFKLALEFFTRGSDVSEPFEQFGSRVEAANINVFFLVTEPAAHLHERVVHPGSVEKV